MTDFAETWLLSRGRFDDALEGLSYEQLNWRLHPSTLTIGEAAVHVAGVEAWFIHQLTGEEPAGFDPRIYKCATDGVVNDLPFPVPVNEMTSEFVARALSQAREMVDPIISAPTEAVLSKQIKSALGPIINGSGAFARIAFHSGYHLGQLHMVKTAAGFPS